MTIHFSLSSFRMLCSHLLTNLSSDQELEGQTLESHLEPQKSSLFTRESHVRSLTILLLLLCSRGNHSASNLALIQFPIYVISINRIQNTTVCLLEREVAIGEISGQWDLWTAVRTECARGMSSSNC